MALSSDIARSLPLSFTRTPLPGRERTTVYLGLTHPNPPAVPRARSRSLPNPAEIGREIEFLTVNAGFEPY